MVRRIIILLATLLVGIASALTVATPASAATGTTTGTVTGPAGAALVDGSQVSVIALTSDEDEAGRTTVAADGTYSLSGLTPGSYVIYFYDGSHVYKALYSNQKQTFEDADTVTVTSGSTVANINAALSRTGSVSGTITAEGGAPLNQGADVWVSAQDLDGESWDWDDAPVSNDGTYVLGGLPTGSYVLSFHDYSGTYAGEFYDNKPTFEAATRVPVTTGADTANINAQLAIGGRISGTITGPGSDDMDSIEIEVTDADENYIASGYADSDGSYSVGGIPTGSFVVEFSDWRGTYAREYYNNQTVHSEANQVEAVLGETTTNIDAELLPNSSITGTVRDANGTPVNGDNEEVSVVAYDSDGSYVDESYLAEDGTYRVVVPQAGQYRLKFEAWAGEYQTEFYSNKSTLAAADPITVNANAQTSGIDVELAAGGSITGTVRGPDGQPIDGNSDDVFVAAYDSDGLYARGTYVQSDGTYALGLSDPGQYRLEFQSDDDTYQNEFYDNEASLETATAVTVAAGGETSGINAQLAYTARIVGEVRDEGGELIDGDAQGITITAFADDNSVIDSTSLRRNGTYRFGGLEPGQYRLKFESADGTYVTEYYDNQDTLAQANQINVAANSSTTINVELDYVAPIVPDEPTGVTAVAGNGSATVSWIAPFDGGLPIEGYTVTSTPGSLTCQTTGATTCTVVGLTNGTAYRFSVVAEGQQAYSDPSALSAAVTPSAPTPTPVPAQAQTVANPAKVIKRGKSKALARKTNAGVTVKWTTATPKVCKVKGSKVVAGKKKGKCKLKVKASGNAAWLSLQKSVTISIK